MDTVVFIIGCPRSGTTLTGRILGSMREVLYWEESCVMQSVVLGHYSKDDPDAVRRLLCLASLSRSLAPEAYPDSQFNVLHDFLRRGLRPDPDLLQYQELEGMDLVTAVLGHCRRDGYRHWVEKSPPHTTMVDIIRPYFPRAVFLHVVRHPLDVIASMKDFCLRNKLVFDHVRSAHEWNEYFDIGSLVSNDSVRYIDLVYSPVICKQLGQRYGLEWTAGAQRLADSAFRRSVAGWDRRLTKREIWESSQVINWPKAEQAGYYPWGHDE